MSSTDLYERVKSSFSHFIRKFSFVNCIKVVNKIYHMSLSIKGQFKNIFSVMIRLVGKSITQSFDVDDLLVGTQSDAERRFEAQMLELCRFLHYTECKGGVYILRFEGYSPASIEWKCVCASNE